MYVFDCLCKPLFQLLAEGMEKYWLTTQQQKEMIKIFFQFNQLDGLGYRYVFNTLKLIDPYMENFISRKLKLITKLDLAIKEKNMKKNPFKLKVSKSSLQKLQEIEKSLTPERVEQLCATALSLDELLLIKRNRRKISTSLKFKEIRKFLHSKL